MKKLRIKQNTHYRSLLPGELEFLLTYPDGRQARVQGSSWVALWMVLTAGIELV